MYFQRFYEIWQEQLRCLVQQLRYAPKPEATPLPPSGDELVEKVMAHFTEYYRMKTQAAQEDVLTLFAAPWVSSLERSLHWVTGWRPTTVFHLLYTESSILFESHIMDILRGCRTGDLGDLSPEQLTRVSELQCQTVKEENAITAELSDWQDNASELVRAAQDLDEKLQRLVVILGKADDLRLRTIRGVVELLNPQQAAEFLIADAELQFGVHEWGVLQDRQRGNV